MVKFKPDLKEVRDIEDDLEQSDDDFDLSEFFSIEMEHFIYLTLKISE